MLHNSIWGGLKFVGWAKPTKAPPWQRDWRTPATNDIVCSGHLQHERERPDMERKYMNNDKAQITDSELTT